LNDFEPIVLPHFYSLFGYLVFFVGYGRAGINLSALSGTVAMIILAGINFVFGCLISNLTIHFL
jgi:hypothetical protein